MIRSPAHLRRRSTIAALAAVVALGVIAAMSPGTSSAWQAKITNGTNSAASASYFTCAGADAADRGSALFQYPLNEASGAARAVDVASGTGSGTYPGTYYGSMTTTTTSPIACTRDTGGAYTLNGSSSYVIAPPQIVNPTTFSLEVWFKTTVAQGKLIGFGNSATGSSGQYDRHLYLTSGGVVNFGIYSGGTKVLTSAAGYSDGTWHHVVGSISPTAGMVLWVDGKNVASNTGFTTPENTTGYWHIGFDNLGGWPNTAAPYYFSGGMRWAAVYKTVLTPSQVADHYNAGRAG